MHPASYEIRLRGMIGRTLAERFDGFDAEIQPAATVLRGEVRDQAELYGVLARIESLGLELVEVRPLGAPNEPIRSSDFSQ
jgi:hypothetical protein